MKIFFNIFSITSTIKSNLFSLETFHNIFYANKLLFSKQIEPKMEIWFRFHILYVVSLLRLQAKRVHFCISLIHELPLYYNLQIPGLTSQILMQTQAEVALAAADGDPNVAIEILMSQQARSISFFYSLEIFFLPLNYSSP